MAFQRRDGGEQLPNTFDFLAQLLGGVAKIQGQHELDYQTKQTNLGTSAIERAKAERDALFEDISNPNYKGPPQQRANAQARLDQLDKVLAADPMEAHALFEQINQGATVNPARMGANINAAAARGDQQREEAVTVAGRRHETALGQQQIDAQADSTLLQIAAQNYAELAAVIRDPAKSQQQKQQAREAMKVIESDERFAGENLSQMTGITDKMAQQAEQAAYRSQILAAEQAEVDVRLSELQEKTGQFELGAKKYAQRQTRFLDEVNVTERIEAAAQAGSMSELQQMKNWLLNPDVYPERAQKLIDAGVTPEMLDKAYTFADNVRGNRENEMSFLSTQWDLTLNKMTTDNELGVMTLTDTLAKNFDSAGDLEQFLKDPKNAKRVKMLESTGGLSYLKAQVKSRETLINKDQFAKDADILLNGPPPANPEAWTQRFVQSAVASGVKPETAQTMAEQAVNGWAMEGEEFDATMLNHDLQAELLREHVTTARDENLHNPRRLQMLEEIHASTLSTDAASRANMGAQTTAQNITNQTLAESINLDMSVSRANRDMLNAQRAYQQAQNRSYDTDNDRDNALKLAQQRLTEAQTKVTNAEAKAAANPLPASLDPEDLSGIIKSRRDTAKEASSQIVANAPKGCFTPLTGDAQASLDMGAVFAYGRGYIDKNSEGYEGCSVAYQEMDAIEADLSELAEVDDMRITGNFPVQLGGQNTNLSLHSYDVLTQVDTHASKLERMSDRNSTDYRPPDSQEYKDTHNDYLRTRTQLRNSIKNTKGVVPTEDELDMMLQLFMVQ